MDREQSRSKLLSTGYHEVELSELKANRVEMDHDPKNQWTWDMVMVFKVGDPTKKVKVYDTVSQKSITITEEQHYKNCTANVVAALRDAGLETDMYLSVQKDEVYCRIGAAEARLMRQADRIDYDLLLDPKKCIEYGKGLGIRLAQRTGPNQLSDQAWYYIYGKYDQLDPEHPFRQELYMRHYTDNPHHPRHNSVFSSTDRIKLTISIVEAEKSLGGASISVTNLMSRNHSLISFFPLHEKHVLQDIRKDWRKWKSTFKSPLQKIRDYFGEAVALYFGFLGYYNRQLVLPAILGFCFFIWQMAENRVDVKGIPAFAIFICIWTTLFLEFWKRKEAKYRVRWGMTNFSQKEQPRPEFHGEWRTSPVDGRLVEFFPWHRRVLRFILSQSVIITLITCVIASVIGIFFFRAIVKEYSWGGIVSGIVNSVQIAILNYVYTNVSRGLNAYENHRTDTEYENALISKTFLFKFVNSYNSLFYIAFVKRHDDNVGGCPNDDCLGELQQQLGTIFISNIVISNTVEVVIPMIMLRLNAKKNEAKEVGPDGVERVLKKTSPEEEFELSPYEGTFDDFDELVIQYGYVSLFVVAFPLAPLAAFLNNIIEVRVDSTKLVTLTRRPEPRGASDIGTWYTVLEIVSFIAVTTNLAMICFETKLINDAVPREAIKVYVFILAEHLVILMKFFIGYFVPDVPKELEQHLARQEYVVGVLLQGVEEEDEEEPNLKDMDVTKGVENPGFDWSALKQNLVEDPLHEFPDYDKPVEELA